MIYLVIGLLGGILSGLVGIGGGIIIVPALMYFANMSQITAQGTSLALLMLPLGIFAVYAYHKAGAVDITAVLYMAGTFIVGTFLGSKIALNLDPELLRKIFAVILLFISLKMFLGK
jgi:uncharacterized membrane protein YfcA